MIPLVAGLGAAASLALLAAALTVRSRRLPMGATAALEVTPAVPVGRRSIGPGSAALGAGVLGLALGALVGGVPGAVGGGCVGAALPIAIDRRRSSRRAATLDEQLVDAVTAMASALRSGRSVSQSLSVAGEEVGPPLGDVLNDAADRVTLGMPLDASLGALTRQIGGSEIRLLLGVVRLHRRTGGALASSLDDLTRTLRSRRDGARELRSLTAQARLSAAILGLLPLGFFLFLSVVARADVEAAYRSTAGGAAIGIGLALQAAAFVWIRSLLRVEVE